jgi:hypothetical protein
MIFDYHHHHHHHHHPLFAGPSHLAGVPGIIKSGFWQLLFAKKNMGHIKIPDPASNLLLLLEVAQRIFQGSTNIYIYLYHNTITFLYIVENASYFLNNFCQNYIYSMTISIMRT